MDSSPVPEDSKIPRIALRAMIVVFVTFALVAIYANVQRARRDKIEQIIVTPIATPSPAPSGP